MNIRIIVGLEYLYVCNWKSWSSASCDGWHLWSRGYLLWVIRPPTHIVQTHLSSSRWQQFDHQVLGNFQWKTIKILILTLIICHNLKPVVGCLLSEWFWNSGIRLVWISWAPKFHPVLSTNCKLIAIYSACGIKNDFVCRLLNLPTMPGAKRKVTLKRWFTEIRHFKIVCNALLKPEGPLRSSWKRGQGDQRMSYFRDECTHCYKHQEGIDHWEQRCITEDIRAQAFSLVTVPNAKIQELSSRMALQLWWPLKQLACLNFKTQCQANSDPHTCIRWRIPQKC